MNIIILGNGGALNDGLPYNSFIINDKLLCELPPDIMLSLNKHSIDYKNIEKVFISHFHGDHYFGLPFFILSLFYLESKGHEVKKKSFYGPKDLKDKAIEIVKSAFTEKHPCLNWMIEQIDFFEIDDNSKYSLINENKSEYFKLDHFSVTYGFTLMKNKKITFAYIPDTIWTNNVEKILKEKPEAVIIDLNGEPDDPVQLHISEKDLKEKAFPITGYSTKYYGTHLKMNKKSSDDRIVYLKEGHILSL